MALLLQIATLLPPAPIFDAELDANYLEAVQQLASADSWLHADLIQLAPKNSGQHATLASFLKDGTDAEVRLSAILGAGCSEDTPLADAFWRRAALEHEEAKTMACLLAPATVPSDAIPMLAWIATDTGRNLPIRATALARLLDAGQTQVWPLVRSILRTGTSQDVAAPGADWKRGGRYELPKRILLLSIQELLKRHEFEVTAFEPNAAWPAQLEQLMTLEKKIQKLPERDFPDLSIQSHPWKRILAQVSEGNVRAQQVHDLLVDTK